VGGLGLSTEISVCCPI